MEDDAPGTVFLLSHNPWQSDRKKVARRVLVVEVGGACNAEHFLSG